MTHIGRVITRPDGKTFHVGGRKAPSVRHGIRLEHFNFNPSAWPATPTSTAYGTAPSAQACLTDILGNDKLGDCTEAHSFHLQALRQAAAGRGVFHPTLDQVIAVYSRDGGYMPGDPSTDNGCDENTVMQNLQTIGIPCAADGTLDKITGSVIVNASDRDLVRAAATAFVGGTICMALPDEWISPFPSSPGWTWKVPASGVWDPNNGHCFTLGDQTDMNLPCWSWGMPFFLDYDALAAGCDASNGGALYFLIDDEILATAAAVAPDGLDWAALIKAFNDAGGNVPVPQPAPPPNPAPAPGGAVTLAQAQAWASTPIASGHPLLTREDAIALANAGLAENWPQS